MKKIIFGSLGLFLVVSLFFIGKTGNSNSAKIKKLNRFTTMPEPEYSPDKSD